MTEDWEFREEQQETTYYGEQIYFVTGQSYLFEDEDRPFKCISVEQSLELLETLRIVGLDSETKGTEIWQGQLLLLQLGNKHFQIVIDLPADILIQYRGSYFYTLLSITCHHVC